jgi:hypothetical protein
MIASCSVTRYRISGFLSLLLLAAFLLGVSLVAAAPPPPGQAAATAPAALKPFLPAQAEELSFVEVKPPLALAGTWVAAYSYRESPAGKEMAIHSRILAVGPEQPGSPARVLWQSTDQNLYNPRVILEPRLTYKGGPVVLVFRNRGAAWEFLEVLGFENQKPVPLDTQEAEEFKLATLTSDNQPRILAYWRHYVTPLPDILEWHGQKLVKANEKYPQYYQGLLQQKGFLQESAQKPLEIAWLTGMAGKRAEAVEQLEKRRAAEQAKGVKADQGLLNAIDSELKTLKAGQ